MQILSAVETRILRITLNRPEKRNALNAAMCGEIATQIDQAQTNPNIGCILLTANGPTFSAGMDLEEARTAGAELQTTHELLFTVGLRSTKPIVIAVNGAALGGGFGLAAQGHIVLASDEATFGLTEIHRGLFPFLIYRTVEAAIGNRNTLYAALTGQIVNAEQAARWGLVHKICPLSELTNEAESLARQISFASPTAIQAGLEYVKQSRGQDATTAGRTALHLRTDVMAGSDFHEGVAAFKAKREPRWPSIPPEFYAKT